MNLSIIIVGKNKQECSVAIKSINSDFEIVIATGDNPSKQRNDAVDFATNEHLLFLDGDSIASDTLFNEYRPFIENNTNNLPPSISHLNATLFYHYILSPNN